MDFGIRRTAKAGDSVGRTRRVLNLPLLVGSFCVLTVLGPLAYAWHAYQVGQIATALLHRADSLAAENQWQQAASYLFRYLQIRSDDADVRVRLAETFDRSAETDQEKRQAVAQYYRALGVAPVKKQVELRQRLAELLLESGRFVEAEQESKKLLAEIPDDPNAHRIFALARYLRLRTLKIADRAQQDDPPLVLLEYALTLDTADLELAACLAELYRDEALLPEDSLVSQLKRSFAEAENDTWTVAQRAASTQIQTRLARQAGLEDDAEFAALCKKIGAGTAADARPDLPAAVQAACQGGAVLPPADEQTLVRLVRRTLSQDAMDQMVLANPKDPKAQLARYQFRSRYSLPGADEDLDAALECDAKNVAALLLASRRAEQRKAWDEVRDYCARLIEAKPKMEEAYTRLGNAMVAQREPAEETIAHYRKALETCGEENIAINAGFARALIALDRVRPVEGQTGAEDVLKQLDKSIGQMSARLPRMARTALELERVSVWAIFRVARGEYSKAIPLLKDVLVLQKSLGGQSSNNTVMEVYLGRSYEALGQWDAAAAVYEEAATQAASADKASTAQFQVAAAVAWMKAGQPARAVSNYEQALDTVNHAELWLGLARARLMTQLLLPAAQRVWEPVDEALAQVESPGLNKPWQVELLKIDLEMARQPTVADQDQEARRKRICDLVRETEHRYPDAAELLQTVALSYERLGFPADADRVLESLHKQAGDSAVYAIAKARLYGARKQYDEACKFLQEAADAAPAGVRPELQREIVRLRLDEGKANFAEGGLALSESVVADIPLMSRLCEQALGKNDFAAAERWENRLRDLEGPNGSQWRYYRAARLLATSQGTDGPPFVEAVELHRQLLTQRPAWPATFVVGAMIAERRQSLDEALAAYKRAIELGLQRVAVYERLVALLYRMQRYEEVDQYMALLKDRVPASENLSEVRMARAVKGEKLDEALRAAQEGIKNRPNDPMANIWLGQMLVLNQQPDAAESAFQTAVRLAPEDRQPLTVLFGHYVRSGKKQSAEETLRQLAAKAPKRGGQAEFVLAQGYEQMGDREQAERQYREAVRLAPKDASILRRFSAFLLQTNPTEAEQVLRRSIQLAPGDQSARRTLAAMLASRGGEREWEEISRLLEQPDSDQQVTDLDRRLQAILLARRGGKDNLDTARKLLERLLTDAKAATDGDRLLLAKILERYGESDGARNQYISLVSKPRPEPLHLTLFIDFLLRFDMAEEAATWLSKLEDVSKLEDDPNAANTLPTLTLKARVRKAQGKTDEIKPMVEKFVEDFAASSLANLDDQQKKTELALAIGNVYSTVELHEAAEAWYRQAMEMSPEQFAPLAVCLAKQGKVDEAMDLCRKTAESSVSPDPAIVLASLAVSGDIPHEQSQKIDEILSQAIDKFPESANLLTAVANVRIIRGEFQKAIELYRAVLKIRPKDLVVFNNLATLLAEDSSSRQEALRFIDEAIEIGGRQDALLDTKAMILVQDGKADQAVKLLDDACSHHNPDPRYPFHLAVAYHRIGKQDDARKNYGKAIESGLKDQILTESDQEMRKELEKAFGQ